MFNKCKKCFYYHVKNNTCQSKKCYTGREGYVTLFDKLFCKPYILRTFCYCDCGLELVKNHKKIYIDDEGKIHYICKCGKEYVWDFYEQAPLRIK